MTQLIIESNYTSYQITLKSGDEMQRAMEAPGDDVNTRIGPLDGFVLGLLDGSDPALRDGCRCHKHFRDSAPSKDLVMVCVYLYCFQVNPLQTWKGARGVDCSYPREGTLSLCAQR